MRVFTKQQVFTYIILSLLLAIRIPLTDPTSIIERFFNPPDIPYWAEILCSIHGWLYFLFEKCSFILVGIIILINRSNLKELNIDKFFIPLFIWGGLVYSGDFFWPLGWVAILISVLIFFMFIRKGLILGDTSPYLLRIVLIIGIVFFLGLLLIKNSITIINIGWAFHWLVADIPPFAIVEEVIFRGLFWMFLKNLNWKVPKIVLMQALLFWLSHTKYLFTKPIMFWIIVPISGVVLGIIVWRSRSITSSTIAHIFINILLSLALIPA